MSYNITYLNQIVADLGGSDTYIYEIDALNAICTLLGITAGHTYKIEALNAIEVNQGGSGGHKYNIAALNSIITLAGETGGYKYEPDAWAVILNGALLNQAVPIDFTLTSTGTGAGVSTLRLWVTEDITLTLDGTARFYDNSAGTVNEGTTRTVTAGAMRTFYLKVPSGTATLNMSDGLQVERWGDNTICGWISSKNAARIGGSIEDLVNLTFLYVTGSNPLSGSVAALTKLTYLRVEGSNTLTGSVAALTKLTYLYVIGSNTLSGDIGGLGTAAMVNGITKLVLTGQNQMADYTAGATWSLNDSSTINPAPGYGYSSTEIDNMLIDMAASLPVVVNKSITLQGSSAGRTSASDAAVTILNGKGWSVITN